jgi:adenylate kinase family enzyme
VQTLGPTDPLPRRPRWVAVAGTSGSGKTTTAGRIAAVLGVPHVELDDLYWGPDWTPRETFMADVRRFVARDGWVTEWQYQAVRSLIAERAEMIVWLDLPVRVRLWWVTRRTVWRRLRRVPLWRAGNVEPPLWMALRDDEHILRWAWSTRHKFDGLPERLADEHPHVTLVRLRSAREVDRWLVELAATHGRP